VGEADHHFFGYPIIAEGLRQGRDFEIRRDLWQEMIGIKVTHSCPTYPGGAGRNEEHVGIFGHLSQSRLRVFEHEFGVGVLLPSGQHGSLVRR